MADDDRTSRGGASDTSRATVTRIPISRETLTRAASTSVVRPPEPPRLTPTRPDGQSGTQD